MFLVIRESRRLWTEEAEVDAGLQKREKPRPSLRVAGYYVVERGWRAMRNSGQVSRSVHEWCNRELELPAGSYSASIRLLGPNVNTTRIVTFTNLGSSQSFTLDSFDPKPQDPVSFG